MAENETVMSARERYLERLNAKYPEREFADDEALFSQMNDDYDSYDSELEGFKTREKSLSDLFASNPRSASFLQDWKEGGDPVVIMIRKFGDDFKAALEDPEKLEAIAEANKEFAERVAKNDEYEEQYEANMTATKAIIAEVQEADGLTDEQIDEAMVLLATIMKDAIVGKYTAESIRMAHKALNHDVDVAIAEQEGEVRGRNTKIVEKLNKAKASDGTADLGGGNNGGSPSGVGAIGLGGNGGSIFERGKMSRTKHR